MIFERKNGMGKVYIDPQFIEGICDEVDRHCVMIGTISRACFDVEGNFEEIVSRVKTGK